VRGGDLLARLGKRRPDLFLDALAAEQIVADGACVNSVAAANWNDSRRLTAYHVQLKKGEHRVKKVLFVVGILLALILLVGAVILVPPHFQIRGIEPELPSLAEIQQLRSVERGPTRITTIEISSQPYKNRSSVNTVFLIEWEDGRIFMVDAGMDQPGSMDFAKQLELFGAGPLNYRQSATQALGDKIKNVQGVGFTHLHIDHTQGVKGFCERRGTGAKVYQTTSQATTHNLHTKEGAQLLQESCLEPVIVEGDITQLKEFPGLSMLHVGGHTPCSTVFFVSVGDKLWVLSGDVSNDKQSLLANKGKGFLYSYLIVPENTRQLDKLRVWLAGLNSQSATEVVVSHDGGET